MVLPQVSVIIPTHNGAPWIRETINSVLQQTYPNIEIIVIDDGSRDSTPEMLREFGDKIHVVRKDQGGIGCARNAGINCANGEYLAFLDHDDLWEEEKVSWQVEYLKQNPQVTVLYTDADEFDDLGVQPKSFFTKFPALSSQADIAEPMISRQAVPLMSTIMLRSAFLCKHGIRFHPQASGVDDLWLLLEIYLNGGTFAKLNERVVKRRLHGGNLSSNHYNRFLRRVTVYRDLLQSYPGAPLRMRRLLAAGLRDANFRVGEWHWGQLDLLNARHYLRAGANLDRSGVKSFVFWVLTFAPTGLIRMLKKLKQRCVGANPLFSSEKEIPN